MWLSSFLRGFSCLMRLHYYKTKTQAGKIFISLLSSHSHIQKFFPPVIIGMVFSLFFCDPWKVKAFQFFRYRTLLRCILMFCTIAVQLLFEVKCVKLQDIFNVLKNFKCSQMFQFLKVGREISESELRDKHFDETEWRIIN